MTSRLALRQVRHLSTTAAAATTMNPSTITISRAKSQLKYVYDPDKAIEIYSSVSPHYTSPLSSRYTQEYAVRRLAKSHRFSDIEIFLESHKNDPKITQEPFLTSIIRSYGIAGMFDHALKTYEQMDELGARRSNVSFNALLGACVSSRKFSDVPQLFDEMPKKYGFLPNKYSYGNLIKAYCEMGSPEEAFERLKEMEEKEIEANAVIYTTIMSSFYRKGNAEEADKLWSEMMKKGCVVDVGAYNVRIRQVCGGDPEAVKSMIEEIKVTGLKPDTISYNYLMTSYCTNGMMDEAMKVYTDLEGNGCKPNAATFRTLIFHLCKKQRFETGYKVFKYSVVAHKIPDFNTMKHLVEGLAKKSKMKEAKGIIRTVKKKFPPNVVKAWEKLQVELGLVSVEDAKQEADRDVKQEADEDSEEEYYTL